MRLPVSTPVPSGGAVIDLQVYALLGRLGAERDAACRALLADAGAQASEVLREARHRARERVRAAVREKRARIAESCRQVRVDIEKRRRDHDFECVSRALSGGLARLPEALGRRWADPEARWQWCEAALAGASRALGRGGWRIEHAPGLDGDERRRLRVLAEARAGDDCETLESGELRCGLRIGRGGAVYDATLDGLCAQRGRLEAALLAEIDALAGRRTPS